MRWRPVLRGLPLLVASGAAAAQAPVAPPAAGPAVWDDDPDTVPRLPPLGEVRFGPVPVPERFPHVFMLRGGMSNGPGPGPGSANWAASLQAKFTTALGPETCTAALVGPQAILTGAHCVGRDTGISLEFAQMPYQAKCRIHPLYRAEGDWSADFALCRIAEPLRVPAGFRFETINTEPMDLLAAPKLPPILLTGYGCTSDIVGAGLIDKRYRIGFNVIVETSNSPRRTRHKRYYPPFQANNLITQDAASSGTDVAPGIGRPIANLCPGDSGGPAFRYRGADGEYANRAIIGVNSRVFKEDEGRRYGASVISATGGPAFPGWAAQWARQYGVAVCGIGGMGDPPSSCRTY